MSREIKFCALCIADGKRQTIYFEPTGFDNGIFAWPNPLNVHHIDEYLSPLRQYTGLKEKNGKEIYEGDIIKFNHPLTLPVKNWIAEVVFDSSNASFGMRGGNTTIKDIIQPFSDYDEPDVDLMPFVEVIGNIYENPELLTQ